MIIFLFSPWYNCKKNNPVFPAAILSFFVSQAINLILNRLFAKLFSGHANPKTKETSPEKRNTFSFHAKLPDQTKAISFWTNYSPNFRRCSFRFRMLRRQYWDINLSESIISVISLISVISVPHLLYCIGSIALLCQLDSLQIRRLSAIRRYCSKWSNITTYNKFYLSERLTCIDSLSLWAI